MSSLLTLTRAEIKLKRAEKFGPPGSRKAEAAAYLRLLAEEKATEQATALAEAEEARLAVQRNEYNFSVLFQTRATVRSVFVAEFCENVQANKDCLLEYTTSCKKTPNCRARRCVRILDSLVGNRYKLQAGSPDIETLIADFARHPEYAYLLMGHLQAVKHTFNSEKMDTFCNMFYMMKVRFLAIVIPKSVVRNESSRKAYEDAIFLLCFIFNEFLRV